MCQMFAGQPQSNYEYSTRSIRLNGQCTSLRLENTFWEVLNEIAESEGLSTPGFISKLHSEVVTLQGKAHNFTSMLRCTCMIYLEKKQQDILLNTRSKVAVAVA